MRRVDGVPRHDGSVIERSDDDCAELARPGAARLVEEALAHAGCPWCGRVGLTLVARSTGEASCDCGWRGPWSSAVATDDARAVLTHTRLAFG